MNGTCVDGKQLMEWLKSIERLAIPAFLWLRFGPRPPDAEPVRGLGEASMSQLPRAVKRTTRHHWTSQASTSQQMRLHAMCKYMSYFMGIFTPVPMYLF